MDTLDGLRVTNKELNDRKARLEDIQKARAEAVKSTESSSQSAESAEQGGNTEEQAPDDVSSVAGNGAVETNSEDAALTGVRANEAQSAEAANSTFSYFSGSYSELIDKAKNKVKGLFKKIVSPVSPQLKGDLNQLGLEIGDDYKHTIDNSAIRHIIKRHGDLSEEQLGQVPITDADIQRIEDIVENYDKVELRKREGKLQVIIYSKTYSDGTTIYVEEKRSKHKELAAVSMWKSKTPTQNTGESYKEVSPLGGSLTKPIPYTPEATPSSRPSTDKGNESSGKTSVSEKKSESGSADTSYFPTDQYGVTPDEELSTMLLEIMEEVGATKENFVVDTSSGYTSYDDLFLIDKDGIAVKWFEPDTWGSGGGKGVTYAGYHPAALDYTDEDGYRLFDYTKLEELINAFNKSEGREVAIDRNDDLTFAFFFNIEDARRFKEFADKYLAKQNGQSKTDAQGNPLNEDGTLKVDVVKSIDELTDEDFTAPTRSVQLPAIPSVVDNAIGANGKPVVIKKNIFEKNKNSHKDLSSEQSREILSDALYNPDLYGQNQKTTRPYNWILIHNAEKHSSVIVEVNQNKDNVEIVNWHYLDDATLKQKERQAVKEGGLILTLESAAGNTLDRLSSTGKDTETSGNGNQSSKKQAGEKQSKPKAQSKAKTDGEKIEDVGEKIAGARKDLAREMAKQLQDATIESLVALPFSKVFKRLDLNKAVAEGVLRPKDARLAEAVLATSLSHPKPRVSSSRSSYERAKNARAIEAWARTAHAGIEILQQLFSMNEAQRDELIEKLSSQKGYNEEALSKRIAD